MAEKKTSPSVASKEERSYPILLKLGVASEEALADLLIAAARSGDIHIEASSSPKRIRKRQPEKILECMVLPAIGSAIFFSSVYEVIASLVTGVRHTVSLSTLAPFVLGVFVSMVAYLCAENDLNADDK